MGVEEEEVEDWGELVFSSLVLAPGQSTDGCTRHMMGGM